MSTKEIYWNLPNQGVGFYKIMQAQNKMILEEADLMITLGRLAQQINDAISVDSLDLKKTTDNLNMLEFKTKILSDIANYCLISIYFMGVSGALSSMALETEEAEASSLKQKLSGTSRLLHEFLGLGKSSTKIWLSGMKSAFGAGIIISYLQAYFSANTGIDNSQIQWLNAFSDGEKEDIKLVNNSENKASQTIQSITKSDQKAIQNDYNSKTQQIYYNN